MVEKVALIVIDGWGVNANKEANGDAIRGAETPVMDGLEANDSFTTLAAHGRAVGLPAGLMGNSEVGHLNIGAGRVVYQDIVRIDVALEEKQFGKTAAIEGCFERAKAGNGRLQLCGLVSDGGVHGHIKHLVGLLEAAKASGVPEAFVHFYADGRDTSPRSATRYVKELQQAMDELEYGKIATIVGRYYAMDRDKRWERVQVAFEAMTEGRGEKSDDPVQTIEERYAKDETDEFLKPIIVNAEGCVKDDDTMFFFDFRSDRMREITQAFGISPLPFDGDVRVPRNLHIATMTQYKADYPFEVAFPPQKMTDVLAEWLAKKDVTQVHVAETEKYAHVTFFFNGGTEAQFKGESRDLIPSPKVATYDMQPAMSAREVGHKVAEEIGTGKYEFVMCNFAPPDMVGHTGDYDAAVQAIAATDAAIGDIYQACKEHQYTLFVTADHGNAEKMVADDGKTPHTAHTCSRVPFIMATHKKDGFVPDDDKHALCDVAPTLLNFMGLPIPEHMTGHSLLK
ncbi:hypothetical protein GGF46_002442 [Coemansia sp. RSA 552]|nr:hypothetical protein GGF46_002442 [Coemansia sp. RSA 552]